MREKQEAARLKYAQEKEQKKCFQEAVCECAKKATDQGLGSTHAFDEDKFKACQQAASFPRLPDWQKRALEGSEGDPTEEAPEDVVYLQEPMRPEEPAENPSIHGINALYEFADNIEGDELQFDLPSWSPQAPAQDKESVWHSQGMRDAWHHDQQLQVVESYTSTRTEQGDSAEEPSDEATPEQPPAEESLPEKFTKMAEFDVPGEVNFVRIARDMCANVRGTAEEISSSLHDMEESKKDLNSARVRVKLQVIEDESSEEEEEEEEEEDVTNPPSVSVNEKKQDNNCVNNQNAPRSGGSTLSALRRARMECMQTNNQICEDDEVQEDDLMSEEASTNFAFDSMSEEASTNFATSGDFGNDDLVVDEFIGIRTPAAPRLVSRKHIAEMGNRPGGTDAEKWGLMGLE